MSLLPENSLVGLISFGALVSLHELSSELPKAYIFRGDRATTADQVCMLHAYNSQNHPRLCYIHNLAQSLQQSLPHVSNQSILA